MRILLIASAYNSMTQRVHAELADRWHEVSVELALGDEVLREAVRRWNPDLVIAPMLTTAIPADIWSARPCFIVHPGPQGDRGPSSLDWAIMSGARRWASPCCRRTRRWTPATSGPAWNSPCPTVSQRIEDALNPGALVPRSSPCGKQAVIPHRRHHPRPCPLSVREPVPGPAQSPRPPGPAGPHHRKHTLAATSVSAGQIASDTISTGAKRWPDPAHA